MATPIPPARATALADLRRRPPTRVLIVALDIGKDVHVVYLVTAAGHVLLPPTPVATLAHGFQQVTTTLDQHLASGAFDLVLLGHEPTGIYHEAWTAHLLAHYAPHLTGHAAPPLRYRLLPPTLVKQERQRTTHRRRKTDAIDVVAIAQLLADGVGTLVPLLDPAERELRLVLGLLRRTARQQARLALDLRRTLDRLWPGALGNAARYTQAHPDLPPLLHLVDSKPLERTRVRLLLEHCPDPHVLAQLGPVGIRQLFQAHGARCGAATADRIAQVVAQSLLPPPALSAVLAQQAQASFALYRAYETQLAQYEAQAVALLPATPGQILTTVPGVSPLLAARYLAGLGDITRFPSAQHVWAFAGFDPNQAESGNLKLTGRISQRGSPYLRATLYQLGRLAAQHCPECIRLYTARTQAGLDPVRATIHVANKLNRILYALLVTQQPYRSPLSAAEDARWQAVGQTRRRRARRTREADHALAA